ncbi:MAG: ThiF family adenylyltransferase [Alphaproteobacteria bacterium]
MADKNTLTGAELERYRRHLALPEFGVAEQSLFKKAKVLIVGAGGLGSVALPFLAGAGIGHITIYDDDKVDTSNLHRQTIYKNSENGLSKAELAAQYAQNLNPDIQVTAIQKRFIDMSESENCDLIFDGSDNFATKTRLNQISIERHIPLIGASVNRTEGQCGIFAGYAGDRPCYHCLFPELPQEARNCNEAGVLGTAAGLTGLYQAHLALLYLAGLYNTQPGLFLSFDFQTHRLEKLTVSKNDNCRICSSHGQKWQPVKNKKGHHKMAQLISYENLKNENYVIVDVRTDEEIANDPMPEDIIHIEVSQIPARYEELPKDKLLAFVCAGNVRSVQAAEYLEALGYENVTVLDKFSI